MMNRFVLTSSVCSFCSCNRSRQLRSIALLARPSAGVCLTHLSASLLEAAGAPVSDDAHERVCILATLLINVLADEAHPGLSCKCADCLVLIGVLGELSLIPENVLQEPVEPVHRAIRSLLAVVDMQCRMLSTEEGRSSLSPLVIQTILSACTLLAKTYFMFSPASYQKSKMSVFKHAPGCYAGRMTLRIETDLPIIDP